MDNFEKYIIRQTANLKKQTIYYFLKEQKISEHYIKCLRNTSDTIKLNGNTVSINNPIEENDVLEISKSPQKGSEIPECDGTLEIIYEDDDYIAVNKPHNLACIPTRKHLQNNLGGQVVKYMKDKDKNFVLRIANRLDRETAGIVVIAKNIDAFNKMNANKTYYAICEGNLDLSPFTIDKKIETISHNGINQMKRIVSENGKTAVTHIFPVKNIDKNCLVKLKLETGRTHQIRVHMSSINHPLVGDTIYNENDKSHAYLLLKELSFTHFRSGKKIVLQVDFPNEWNMK